MTVADALDLYQADCKVGRLFDERPLRFVYDDAWLNSPGARAISPAIALNGHDHAGDAVHAFFENLLPEGHVRKFLQISRHATTVFGLLRSVGGDTASGLTILPQGEQPAPPHYRPSTWQEVAARLRNGAVPALVAENAEGARISLAGAQDKLLLMVAQDGSPALPEGTAPSSHILKPDIQGLDGVWASALNEALVMQLADKLGLGVAQACYQSDTRACLIRRYDRLPDGQGGLLRLHQLDLCQLAGKPSDVKYEADGGPTLADCCKLLKAMSVGATDLKRFLQWVIFNLCVGNNDSHAKNLSVLQTADGRYRLAPFYDLMCTAMYPGLAKHFAFAIGGEMKPGNIGPAQLDAMAHDLGFNPRYVRAVARALMAELPAALDQVQSSLLEQAAAGTERTLIERLGRWIASNTRKHAKRWE
ncbi:type II toxin-antitoxin system HipA family toxin [Achromobacter marplatensis]|uniref:Type II toxin-antitoxin system HipA family toxin n=1 Tax=Achromobacter marplatensis TaxID=470868 RepID=A0AA42W8T7_9BURK|nr:type II toxin-antitoxin system HipA family toxin [Achromobacter marplatensis]EJO33327.1 HipA N-terminal domain-containing protein 2 [Achromobacter marplatensis]MDH2050755.1 type II toxin-antitoxin system HipA family toxin [Achromobacter marplatensis]